MSTELATGGVRHLKALRAFFGGMLALAVFVAMVAPQNAFAVRRAERHHRLFSRFRNILRGIPRFLWNPMFRPSHDSLLRQNEEIDRLELHRIQDDDELEAMKASHELVPIVADEMLRFDPRLDPSRRYCRPWTRDFVVDLSESYYRQFHQQIQVNSAVRTVMVQKKLRRRNRNAAPVDGDTASSHLAGVTVDLQRRGMSKVQVHFVERYLFYLNALGLVEPEEERHQWVFHVMVSERYTEWRQTQSMFSYRATEGGRRLANCRGWDGYGDSCDPSCCTSRPATLAFRGIFSLHFSR